MSTCQYLVRSWYRTLSYKNNTTENTRVSKLVWRFFGGRGETKVHYRVSKSPTLASSLTVKLKQSAPIISISSRCISASSGRTGMVCPTEGVPFPFTDKQIWRHLVRHLTRIRSIIPCEQTCYIHLEHKIGKESFVLPFFDADSWILRHVGTNLPNHTASNHEVRILTFWRRNNFFLILAHLHIKCE